MLKSLYGDAMKKRVLVSFVSIATQEGQKEVHTTSTQGTLVENSNGMNLRFQQSDSNPAEVLIIFSPTLVNLTRIAEGLKSNFHFRLHEITPVHYETPYGRFPMQVKTTYYQYREDGFTLDYELWVQGSASGHFRIIINFSQEE